MYLKQFQNVDGCECGKSHILEIKSLRVGRGALEALPDEVEKLGAKRTFLLADVNTYPLAGERIQKLLAEKGISCLEYVFSDARLEPDEKAVGSALMHYDMKCDIVVALGSGVINDIGKILSSAVGVPYVIVATAPSMDGYASATSSMAMDGVKVSLPSKCADVIIGDTDLLKNAPLPMLKAGLGDMLAKYISICEWRIAGVITGEYYCEKVASMVREALKKCLDNAQGLLKREEEVVEAVFEGLVLCGAAMSFAGVSRPASGVEHYFSHIWDMRGLEFGSKVDLHGIQCAVGTYLAVRLYEKLKEVKPDVQKALCSAREFDFARWSSELRSFLGKGAEAMIVREKREGKYDLKKHKLRLGIITENWNQILEIIREELPTSESIKNLLTALEIPFEGEECGIDKTILPMTFKATKDIRDKYVLSRLAWDLGILEELAQSLSL